MNFLLYHQVMFADGGEVDIGEGILSAHWRKVLTVGTISQVRWVRGQIKDRSWGFSFFTGSFSLVG